MDSFLQEHIFSDLETDYAKIKIERFYHDGFIDKIDITDNFRMRLDYVLGDYDNIKEKRGFIEDLFESYEVKVTLNFKNEKCITKFFNEDGMKYKIEFKIDNLVTKYQNIINCVLCVYDVGKYELKLLNRNLLK